MSAPSELPEFEDGVPSVVEYDLTHAADHICIFWCARTLCSRVAPLPPKAPRRSAACVAAAPPPGTSGRSELAGRVAAELLRGVTRVFMSDVYSRPAQGRD